MPEQIYILLRRIKAAKESQCLLGPLAFREFPAENTPGMMGSGQTPNEYLLYKQHAWQFLHMNT